MNILVTGGAGFIGSLMARRHLDDGHRVLVVDDLSCGERHRVPAAARFEQADIAEVDLAPLLSRERIDLVSHHAAHIDVRKSLRDPAHDARVNIQGSLRLLEACRQTGVRRVLFASTGGALYGEAEAGRPMDEQTATHPLSPYGCAKLAVEHYLHYYRVVHGFQTLVFRYANVYGPGQSGRGEAGVVAIFLQALLEGRTPQICGDGEQTRDYVYVGDLVEAASRALRTMQSGTWNLGTGLETSVNQLLGLIAGALDRPGPAEHVAATPGELRRSVLDGSAIRRTFDLPPWTRLADGLAATAAHARQVHQARPA